MKIKKIGAFVIAAVMMIFAVSCTTVGKNGEKAEEDKSVYIDLTMDIKGLKEDSLATDLNTVNKLARSSKIMAGEKKALSEAKKLMWQIDDDIEAFFSDKLYSLLKSELEERGYEVRPSMNTRYILHTNLNLRHDRSESLASIDYSLVLRVEDTKHVPIDEQQNPTLTKYDSKLDLPSIIDTKDRWLKPSWGINGSKTGDDEIAAAEVLLEEIEEQLVEGFFGQLL